MYSRRDHQTPKQTRVFRPQKNAEYKNHYHQHQFFQRKNNLTDYDLLERELLSDKTSLSYKIALLSVVLLMMPIIMQTGALSHSKKIKMQSHNAASKLSRN